MTHDHDRSDTREPAIEALLAHLDPARSNPNYWPSLRWSLVAAARLELARRRRESGLTVTGVVTSWARTVVPSAMVAAAAAVVTLLVVPAPPAVPVVEMGIEELLSVGLDGDAVPASVDEPSASISLASVEIF